MKQKFGIVKARRERILALLAQESPLKVLDLARLLNVSALTIRRDLDELAEQKMIERFHGGASLVPLNVTNNPQIDIYKEAIAKRAAEFVNENDTLFINSSSTALLVLKYLRNKHVTVITNNAKALALDIDPKVKLVLTGGDIAFPKESLTGEFTLNNLSRVAANKAILGVSGLSLDVGLTTSTLDEIAVNAMMIKNTTGDKLVVTDSSKLGATSSFVSGEAQQITRVITDKNAPLHVVEKLTQCGVEVIQV